MGYVLDVFETQGDLLMVLSGVSLVLCVVSLAGIPWIIKRMPADYFVRAKRLPVGGGHAPARVILAVVRNIIGVLFLAAGIVMLVTPGQGLLTMLLGIIVMEFPGKRRLEAAFLKWTGMGRFLNRVRGKKGLAPFIFFC
ncbi:MAG: PGPGW domain-containing protein [Pseudomonadota bacterium]